MIKILLPGKSKAMMEKQLTTHQVAADTQHDAPQSPDAQAFYNSINSPSCTTYYAATTEKTTIVYLSSVNQNHILSSGRYPHSIVFFQFDVAKHIF